MGKIYRLCSVGCCHVVLVCLLSMMLAHSSPGIVVVWGITGEEEKSVEERAYVAKGEFHMTSGEH